PRFSCYVTSLDVPAFRLPDPAGVCRHHRLAGLATEGFLELRHVLHYAVYAPASRRVGIGANAEAQVLCRSVLTPHPGKTQEVALIRGVTVDFLAGVLLAFGHQVVQRHQRYASASVISRVFAKRQLPIQMEIIDGHKAAVLLINATRALFKLLT